MSSEDTLIASVNSSDGPQPDMVECCGGTCTRRECYKQVVINVGSMFMDVTLGSLIYYNILMDVDLVESLAPSTVNALWLLTWLSWLVPGSCIMFLPALKLTWSMRAAQPIRCCGWTGWIMMSFVIPVVCIIPIMFLVLLAQYADITDAMDPSLVTFMWIDIATWPLCMYYALTLYSDYKAQMDAAMATLATAEADPLQSYGTGTGA